MHAMSLRKSAAAFSAVLLASSIGAVIPLGPSAAATPPIAVAFGDLAVSTSAGVDEYTPSGTFVQHLVTPAQGLILPTGSAFDNGDLYVTDFNGDQIFKRSGTTGAVTVFANNSTLGDGHVFNAPESIVFNKGYTRMYVSDANRLGPGGGINVIDMATGKGVGFFPLPFSQGSEGAGESDWLAFDTNGNLFMTNENPSQGVMQVNPSTGDIVYPSLISNLPNYGYGLSFDHLGGLWVGETNQIAEYNAVTGGVIQTITNPNFSLVFDAVFDPGADHLYAGDLGNGNIYNYDQQGNLKGTFNVGSGVEGLSVGGAAIPPNSTSINYVALGDSYSSGEGNPPFEAGSDANGDWCHRSPQAGTELLSQYLGTNPQVTTTPMSFNACSGATTASILTQNHYTEGPQIGHVSNTTNLVTLTIGGNDAGFSNVVQACIMQDLKQTGQSLIPILGAWLNIGSDPSCADSSAFTSTVTSQIAQAGANVTTTLQRIRDNASSDASILLADYPHLFPAGGSSDSNCLAADELTPADQTFLNSSADQFSSVLSTSANEVGVNFVDVRPTFTGHELCTNNPYLHAVTVSAGSDGCSLSVAGVCLWSNNPQVGSFHPNTAGQSGYAQAYENFITNATSRNAEGLPADPPPATMTPKASMTTQISKSSKSHKQTHTLASTAPTYGADDIFGLVLTPLAPQSPTCEGTYKAGQQLNVSAQGFLPGTQVTIYSSSPGQASLEQQIGSLAADSNGAISASVQIPQSATGFKPSGAAVGLIGFDAIGLGPNGATHGDANAIAGLAGAGNSCGATSHAVAGGNYHSLAVKSDGTVWAWGANYSGQLGNGTTTDATTPTRVSGLTGAQAVTAADADSAAIKSDGTVWTWGYNKYGELGDGTTATRLTPVQVPGLSSISDLAAGGDHMVALKSDGTVWTWGYNKYGELGNGTTNNSKLPVQVSGLSGVTAVAAGTDQSYALKSDGTVWAWGYNADGELGNSTTAASAVPVRVTGLSGISSVASGYLSGYALKTDGTVWAWGNNLDGQVGNGTTTNATAPVQVSGLSNVVAITGGGYHTLAVTTDGSKWAWGLNNHGQIGVANTPNLVKTPVQITGLPPANEVGAGFEHSLIVLSDGTVRSFGYNNHGQIGNGTTTDATTPVTVSGLSSVP